MKQGQRVNQYDLTNDGWSQVDCFGSCEIWAKGSERMLWNPQTKVIEKLYDAQGI